ncbi:TPA: TraR/DksA family transcriptional regulator [Vibrio parahaemolyticus]|uniref:TraR/DksA family transcriptional regulator n=1 Tax=Vibrio campbellii TaxID=680 RepID=UPI001F074409|nr:TraR/DksA family transcriptional regulator [Vibrio campbellii]UMM06755.1 TraR/DksA family transcriptional regulator [Vibrio campbellii]
MKHFLKPGDISEIRGVITTQILTIEDRINSPLSNVGDGQIQLADMNDRATLEEERNQSQAQRLREEVQLMDLKNALFRIDNETEDFGYCESCGAEIEKRRLLTVPSADYCVDCQNFKEIKSKQGALH